LNQGKEVTEKTTRPFASKLLHERGTIANIYIDTAIRKRPLKIGTMLRKAMGVFQFIYLVFAQIVFFGNTEVLKTLTRTAHQTNPFLLICCFDSNLEPNFLKVNI
jgi:hypothetical protein